MLLISLLIRISLISLDVLGAIPLNHHVDDFDIFIKNEEKQNQSLLAMYV